VQELADAVIGKAVGAAFARACHAASGGNPRFHFRPVSDSQHRLYPVGSTSARTLPRQCASSWIARRVCCAR